jgi:cytochrome c oxidase cbb3-type subunit 3/ubiquinol-cytochrome c reductase cytochrome c subunit
MQRQTNVTDVRNRCRPRWLRRLVTLSPLLLAAGCDLPGRPNPADRPVPDDWVVSFDVLFGRYCAGCHGAEGRLGPAPPLNDPLFRNLVPERVVEAVISIGRDGTPMPAFGKDQGGGLTDIQVQVLVHEIKGVPYRVDKKEGGKGEPVRVVDDPKGESPRWGMAGPYPLGAPSYLAPQGKAGDPGRGSRVFARACAGCHGGRGQGSGEGDKRIGAVNEPAFLALISDQALRRYAITGRPDLGMPDYARDDGRGGNFRPLTSAEVADLVALLASWRQSGPASRR